MPDSSAPTPVVFLLSPAHCGGRRARMAMNPEATWPLATRLREPEGAPLGEVFSFLSGLYFRGKLAYARAFTRGPVPSPISVITPGRGLLDVDHRIRREDLLEMAEISVSLDERRYREPLERDARRLAREIEAGVAVLLGSIATDKYVEILGAALGDRLLFPTEFVGRGDMSRGGLMLRCAAAGTELSYAPIAGATRHGPRPPRLQPLR